jgi:hypothetical protein
MIRWIDGPSGQMAAFDMDDIMSVFFEWDL